MPSAAKSSMHDAAEHLRYVFREVILCPKCESPKYRVYGHGKPQDATKEQYARCINPKCGHRFKIIWEPPSTELKTETAES